MRLNNKDWEAIRDDLKDKEETRHFNVAEERDFSKDYKIEVFMYARKVKLNKEVGA